MSEVLKLLRKQVLRTPHYLPSMQNVMDKRDLLSNISSRIIEPFEAFFELFLILMCSTWSGKSLRQEMF